MQVLHSLLGVLAATPTTDPVDWLSRGGAIGILAYGVIAFQRGWIVSGSSTKAALDEMKAQRDKALDLVYEHAQISIAALEVSKSKNGHA